MGKVEDHLIRLTERYPDLKTCREDIEAAYILLKTSYEQNGKLLICGNGGSSADASHITGELMKGFLNKRELPSKLKQLLSEYGGKRGVFLSQRLQQALPTISLGAHQSLLSAVANDLGADLVYAQQVMGYGQKGDVLLGISTSGNAENVISAAVAAKAAGLKVIGLTGESGGNLKEFCDVAVCVPSSHVPDVQELHLPVYHTLCAMLETYFFG